MDFVGPSVVRPQQGLSCAQCGALGDKSVVGRGSGSAARRRLSLRERRMLALNVPPAALGADAVSLEDRAPVVGHLE
jgi:hypothetical protein